MRGAECVVLLHGLGRTRFSMTRARMRLEAAGFRVVNIQYRSMKKPIGDLADDVRSRLSEELPEDCTRVHFLTHSMGGIVLRALIAGGGTCGTLGHSVMLAPPNRGSQVAARLLDGSIFRAVLGPAGQQLKAGAESLPLALGPADYVVGIIAGNRPSSPWARLIDGDNDGTVAVSETTLEGMTDFLVVPCSHTFMMNDLGVINQAIHFFRNGAFARDKSAD
jgi:triacylglycerol lipase